jgi:hypothetical protein
MNWIKTLSITAIWLSFITPVHAQQRHNIWFRNTLSIPVGKKFKIDNEIQHRRQNGFQNQNIFDRNLMFTYRNWIHYQPNDNVRFSLSPFAYFSNYKIILKEEDENARPNIELRFSAAVDLQQILFNKFYLVGRTAMEYRVFSSNSAEIIRLRNRFGFRYDITEKVKIGVYDEMFFNLSGTDIHHFFDHDRIGINVEYKVLPFLKFEIGYIHITRLPLISVDKHTENNLFLNVTYQLTAD